MDAAKTMVPMSNGGINHAQPDVQGCDFPDESTIVPEAGLLLMDALLNAVAFDRGASIILNRLNEQGLKPERGSLIPREILDIVRNRKSTTLSSSRTQFRVGRCEYSCRTYLVEFHTKLFSQPILAVHLEKVSSVGDHVHEARVKYSLTEREEETLRGISMGLTAKEVADLMNISPNTVKAFLRLIMIKMGVTTRAGIIAKILQNGPAGSQEPAVKHPEMGAAAGAGSSAHANADQRRSRIR
jgi:DNA-binding CsgD family transcriptional regulator